jgi:SAM-dependent methyltransferase
MATTPIPSSPSSLPSSKPSPPLSSPAECEIPSSSSAAEGGDESCTTASLLQYYDACAEYYDQVDSEEADTYICVDRVSSAILRTLGKAGGEARRKLVLGAGKGEERSTAQANHRHLSTPTPSSKLSLLSLHSSSPSPSPTPEDTVAGAEDVVQSGTEDEAPCTPSSAEDSPRSSVQSISSSGVLSESSISSAESSAVSTPASPALPVQAPLKVLDLGVGTGLASRPLFANLSSPRLIVPRRSSAGEPKLHVPQGTSLPEIWGVDLSPNMLKVSSVLPFRHLIAGDLNTHLADATLHLHSPLSSARLPRGYFDVVCTVGTTEFVRDLSDFFDQVMWFLKPAGGVFCGTFPSNQTQTYPSMSWTTVERLTELAQERKMTVLDVQQYRGWSVSSEEHVEYIQILLQTP